MQHPTVPTRTLLVGEIDSSHLRPQVDGAKPLADDEFVATLQVPGLSSPSHVVGRQVDGRAYDRIALTYEIADQRYRRMWGLVSHNGDRAEYRLLEDSGTRRGYATVPANVDRVA